MRKLKERISQAIEKLNRVIRTHRAILGVILGGVLIVLFLWLGPKWHVSSYRKNFIDRHYWSVTPNERMQIDREMLKAENDARVTLAQIIGGIGLLAGLYFTWRNLKINEDGKITDRYSKAIELLGSDKLDIRLGGIYALERVAKDSEKDHWTVMEALTAFVREHAPVKTKQKAKQGELFEASGGEKRIATDIQAVLTVLSRRKWLDQEKEKGQKLDLNGANLRKASLKGADLSGADLSGANLKGADLFGADLSGANLKGANLSGANLLGAYLIKANLYGANLKGADLFGADLSGANLKGANLSGANLIGADLSWAGLSEAGLSGATLSDANLFGADLSEADLSEADLSRVTLSRVTLSGANLSGANLSWANLEGADLSSAENLTEEQISQVITKETKFPPELEAKIKGK